MEENVYAIYDLTEEELHVFKRGALIPIGVAVASYLSNEVVPDTFVGGIDSIHAKKMLREIEASDSVSELTNVLADWEFVFKSIVVI